MASSTKRPRNGTAPVPKVTAALEALDAGRAAEALHMLEPLYKRFPDDARLLRVMAGALHSVGRYTELQDMLEVLADLDPDAGIRFFLAGIYARNGYLFRSLDLFEKLWKKYPDDRRSAALPEMLETAQKMLTESKLDVPLDERRDVFRQREELQFHIDRGRLADARRVARKLLDRWPNDAATLNLQSNIELIEGQPVEALRLGRRGLELEPGAIFPMSTVVRAHCLMGEFEQARTLAATLLQVETDDAQSVVHKARALAMVGDHAALLVMIDEFEAVAAQVPAAQAAAVRTWLGVAEIATGDEETGREQLVSARALDPAAELTLQNLLDLEKPPAERDGPFTVPTGHWLGARFLKLHGTALERFLQLPDGKRKKEEAQLLLCANPFLEKLLPTLLERGDRGARQLCLDLAMNVDRPACHEALLHFVGTQGGPDQVRWRVVQWLQARNLLTDDTVRVWWNGEWEERSLEPLVASHGRQSRAAAE